MHGIDRRLQLAVAFTNSGRIKTQHQYTGASQLARQLYIESMWADPVFQAGGQQNNGSIAATGIRTCHYATQHTTALRHLEHFFPPAHANHSARQSMTTWFTGTCNGSCRRGSNQNGRVSSVT